METIASVLKALQEYERAGGFTPAAAEYTEDVALAAPAARVEPTKDASVSPHADGGREASPPSQWKLPKLQPLSQSLSQRRLLLGKR
jgi:hypothetical protein